MSDEPLRILLAGPPRSGTTWVANVLAATPAARTVLEPDNEKTSLLARAWKDGLPRFPVLVPGDSAPEFERLWRSAFDGRYGPFLSRSWLTRALMRRGRAAERRIAAKAVPGPRWQSIGAPAAPPRAPTDATEVRIVKTVHAVLCLDWVCDISRPHHVVLVDRHPLAVIDSWRRLSMPDGVRLWRAGLDWLEAGGAAPENLALDDALVRMALQLGLMIRCIDDFGDRQGGVIRVAHEALCEDPGTRFAELCSRLGLSWTGAAERTLAAGNREGGGYRPVRVARREVGKWQGRFTVAELDRIGAVLSAFGLDLPAAA
jgi:hypothetical protein